MVALGTFPLQHASTTPLSGGGSYSIALVFMDPHVTGNSGTASVTPRWRHTLHNTWQTPWDASVTLTSASSQRWGRDTNDPNQAPLPGSTYGGYDLANRQIPNYSYLDLFASWQATKQLQFRAGVNNLLDKQPPIITNPSLQGGGQANTFATYDALGRQVFAAFTAKL